MPHSLVTGTIAAFSGLCQGLFGTGGPPIVLFLSHRIRDRTAFRAALLIYFLVLDSVLAVTYFAIALTSSHTSLTGPRVIGLGGTLLIPALVGAAAGDYMQQRFEEAAFRRGVAAILIVAGLLIIQRGLSAVSY